MSQYGGAIASQSKNAPTSYELLESGLDKRISTYLGADKSSNIEIAEQYYETVQAKILNTSSNQQQFKVASDLDSMISLSESFFIANYTVTRSAGGGATENYCFSNFASDLLTDQINIQIGGKPVNDNHSENGLYAYSAFVKSILTKPREVDTMCVPVHRVSNPAGTAETLNIPTWVQESPDAACLYESLGPSSSTIDNAIVDFNWITAQGTNEGILINTNLAYYKNLNSPYTYDGQSNVSPSTVELKIVPKDGAWRQQRYLPPGADALITLTLNANNAIQYNVAGDKPTVALNNITLYVKRVKPKMNSLLAINSALAASPSGFTYPISYSRAYTINIPTGSTQFSTAAFTGTNPNAVIAMLVPTATFNNTVTYAHPFSCGALAYNNSNPMPTVKQFYVKVGSQRYPREGLELTNSKSAGATIGAGSAQQSYDEYRKMCLDYDLPFLTYAHWKNQFTVFCVNTVSDGSLPLTADTDDTRVGDTTVNIVFSAALATDMTLVAIALQNAEFSINKNRNVETVGFD